MNKTDRHTLLGIDKQILRETSAIVDFIYRIYKMHILQLKSEIKPRFEKKGAKIASYLVIRWVR